MIRSPAYSQRTMSSIRSQISISLDGFVAGPNQSVENPIGEGGMRLHEWAFATDSWRRQHGLDDGVQGADAEVVEEVMAGVGAYIMGRNMFGGGNGGWGLGWGGWGGGEGPDHPPGFVLAPNPRE